eukprot:1290248-Pyramimonas_sp.AAC.1
MSAANEALLVKIARYLAVLNAIRRDWIVMGDWNLAPDLLSSGWLAGVNGFVAAPPRPTCLSEQPGSIIDYAL